MTSPRLSYDYIVVGAGCVIASRLSEDPNCNVLLLEGGGLDDHPDVKDPTKWPTLFYGALDWGWRTAPLRSCFNELTMFLAARCSAVVIVIMRMLGCVGIGPTSIAGPIRGVLSGVVSMYCICSRRSKTGTDR